MGEIDPITGAPLSIPGTTPVIPTPMDPAMASQSFEQSNPYNTINPKAFNTNTVAGVFGTPNPGTFTSTVNPKTGVPNTNYTR
jgi:hypothetical protein